MCGKPWTEHIGILGACRAKRAAEHMVTLACREWAEDHSYLQVLCREAGVSEKEIYGDSYGIPSISDLADSLVAKLKGETP